MLVVTPRFFGFVGSRVRLEGLSGSRPLSDGDLASSLACAEQYAIHAFGHLQLRALEADHVDALLAKMRRDGASRNTMMRVRANLSMALDEAVARHKVRFNAAKLVTIPEPLCRPEAAALRSPRPAVGDTCD